MEICIHTKLNVPYVSFEFTSRNIGVGVVVLGIAVV